MDVLIFIVGAFILWLVFWDLFQSIVLPRPSPGWFRISRYFIRGAWRAARALSGRDGDRRERWLGYFAPAITIAMLGVWLAALMLGYGLLFFAIRGELHPVPADLGSAVYFAGTCILTIGFGDVVPVGGLARAIAVVAAASGLGAVALVVTYLYSLFGSYQRREAQVVALQALAGAPPSAVTLLEAYRSLDLVDRLPDLFLEWERWAAEVLDTHVAYPLLGYFRSSHDNLTWIGALGSMLDAATLVLTTIEDVPRGEAERFRRVGEHLVEDISNLGFRTKPRHSALLAASAAATGPSAAPSAPHAKNRAKLSEEAFELARVRLSEAGYRVVPAEQAWPAFRDVRGSYQGRLEGMAAFWAMRTTSWLGTDEAPRSPAHP